ncbi:MAG: hypothetical protein R8G60_11265 [Roseovarius pacificus]|nr:hypothetical protein [Roseovarius pacificus]
MNAVALAMTTVRVGASLIRSQDNPAAMNGAAAYIRATFATLLSLNAGMNAAVPAAIRTVTRQAGLPNARISAGKAPPNGEVDQREGGGGQAPPEDDATGPGRHAVGEDACGAEHDGGNGHEDDARAAGRGCW